ncbi:hypothetical protein CDO52_17125 [Nocardiopsis gilva YIM 90087]|uniref:Uncharacterized protein n=1 Tax=Nocardiopsis gilva YIM 90087 TaxID=1235441 RepID=A0A223S845_9ACTN|nr:hypothetical protein [Nocardiopsis gilva]ASU84288.1 hypothetical protein CDO52_17125 [Nocardiopsis gilva YIM 90087]
MLLRISRSRPHAHRPLILFVVVLIACGLLIGGDSIATALLVSLGALAIVADLTPRLTPRSNGVGGVA